ncbi:MAG: DNA cytosine methyltransferase [Candidatus Puniceispirillaceae bacterium]
MKTLELFSGAGGLALGLEKSGYSCIGLLEKDKNACNTLRKNFSAEVFENDIQHFSYKNIKSKVELVAGGPPCQPFSLGGKAKGKADKRDMFPEASRAIAELNPKGFIFENVKGLLRDSFSTYLEYIILRLSYPFESIKNEESWIDHLSRLEKIKSSATAVSGQYQVLFRCLNAADYGVPQRRERVFIVGLRKDLGVEWSFPEPTHSADSLAYAKFVTEEYWQTTNATPSDDDFAKIKDGTLKKSLINRFGLFEPRHLPWQTVRQALKGLPEPNEQGSKKYKAHILKDGAKSYPGHTGSPLDDPSKALKAGVHGVPGGENTLRRNDGSVRYFTVREAARIQTFPDDFEFSGAWSENMRQLGNAVPVELGQTIGLSLSNALKYI